jgi:hypothetical protein
VIPVYEDGQVRLYCGDFRAFDVDAVTAAAVVTSPPYNVGLDYDEGGDAQDWPVYWAMAAEVADLMALALAPGGRAWVNTAVAVPGRSDRVGGSVKTRVMLAYQWAMALERSGFALVDQVGVVLYPRCRHRLGILGITGGPQPARRLGVGADRLQGRLGTHATARRRRLA